MGAVLQPFIKKITARYAARMPIVKLFSNPAAVRQEKMEICKYFL
jgi:hypothetical protein